MTTGEVKVREIKIDVIPLESGEKNQAEFVEVMLENEIFVKEKAVSNLRVSERFSRLKKSLRRKSVSIL